MNCPVYGCDIEVKKSARGDCFVCAEHGEVNPILHVEKIDLRVAQALLEIDEMVRAGKRHIFH